MKQASVILAEGFEEIEALTVVDVLRRGKVNCDMISLKGNTVTGAHGIEVKSDKVFEKVDFEEYDIIILPGGMPGAANLREDERIVALLKHFNEKNKYIAAICAAPIALERAGLTEGRTITSFPEALESPKVANYLEEVVVIDKNIITSRGPATAIEFSLKILEILELKEEAEKLRESMMVNFYKNN